jgi:hypothetical protein
MLNESKMGGVALGAAAEVKRWSAGRKKEVVLRLLRGEPVDAISREVSVPIYKLERWRDRALAGIEAGSRSGRMIPSRSNWTRPTAALANGSWRWRFCAKKGRPPACFN